MASSGFKLPKTYAVGEEGELQFNSGSLFSGSTGLKYNFDTNQFNFSSSMTMNVVTTGEEGNNWGADAFSSGSDVGGGTWHHMDNAEGAPNGITAGTTAKTTHFTPTNYLVVDDYGFSIPADAIIAGIEIEVTRKAEESPSGYFRSCDYSIYTAKDATDTPLIPLGDNLSGYVDYSTPGPNGFWSDTTFGTSSFGGAEELWGQTWTPSDINSSRFGLLYQTENGRFGSGGALVDAVGIKVYWTIGVGLADGDPGIVGKMFVTSSVAFGMPATSGTFNVLCISTGSV